jgi:hypothetical protein
MTRQEVLLDTRKKLQDIGLPKLKDEVGKYFFEMDQTVEALYYALTSGFNIILYGPGGFGKTQVVKKFLEVAGISNSTIVGYEDMEVDGLLGVVDIKKLTEEAIYEIKFENSVFRNPGVLILEEFLDARPSTAAALKDILTEGGYRRGSDFVESLISSVIICTNKCPDEVVSNLSTAAFYKERFPIVIEVAWDSFDSSTYLKFLYHIKPEKSEELNEYYQVIAELAARTSNAGNIVSPRIVKYASDLIDVHGDLICLRHLYGLNTDDIDEVYAICRSRSEKVRIDSISATIRSILKDIQTKETMSVLYINESLGKIDFILSKLDTLPILNADHFGIIAKVREECNTTKHNLTSVFSKSLSTEDQSYLNKLFEL